MANRLSSTSYRMVLLCWAATIVQLSLALRISKISDCRILQCNRIIPNRRVSSIQRSSRYQSYSTDTSLFAAQAQGDDNKIGLSFFDKLLKSVGEVLKPSVGKTASGKNIQLSLKREEAVRRVPKKKVIIIGTGMSGLASAKELMRAGCSDFLIIDSADAPGGRVRTDTVDGYLLDRGFQVFIDSYPESLALFDGDFKALNLKSFLPGALVHFK